MFDTILSGIGYVIGASFFYQAMGTTAAIGIFIGASIYNGDVKMMWKGVISIGSYAVLIILTTVPRLVEALNGSVGHGRPGMEYAGVITIFFVTLWYLIGMLIGVHTVQRVRKHR